MQGAFGNQLCRHPLSKARVAQEKAYKDADEALEVAISDIKHRDSMGLNTWEWEREEAVLVKLHMDKVDVPRMALIQPTHYEVRL